MDFENTKKTDTDATIIEMAKFGPDQERKEDASEGTPVFDPLEGSPFPPIPGVTDRETHQLTLRSLVFGALIGCIGAGANIYLGLMIGWGFGVGMLSAMLGYASMKTLGRVLPERFGGGYFGPKENCSIQTVANAASSGTSVFVAA
jgi:hypothetical protein